MGTQVEGVRGFLTFVQSVLLAVARSRALDKEFGGERQAQTIYFARDASRRIAGSFRRVLLGPTRPLQQHTGMRPAALWQVTYERQESLQILRNIISTLK